MNIIKPYETSADEYVYYSPSSQYFYPVIKSKDSHPIVEFILNSAVGN